ncbi:ribonuclease P protein subunit p25-like protein [Oscarella lobularis]|uniref:ribonuclease P protein subunit p25-like protein n=1 Tax=Oscarella lobularis TaxID=121494 RepID=UPI003313DED0
MEHYEKKGVRRNVAKAEDNEIRISGHARVRVLVSRALGKLQSDGHRSVVLKGEGHSCTKTISVAEIVKRRLPSLHQNTRILYSDVEEVWSPKDATMELDELEVVRKLPSIHIALSMDPLDSSADGYQAPKQKKKKSPSKAKKSKPTTPKKDTFSTRSTVAPT